MKCTHTWGGHACDEKNVGLLCYVPRGEQFPRVDFSCEKFMNYHYKHGGIIVLVSWEIDAGVDIGKWLDDQRELFQEKVSAGIRPVLEKEDIIAGAMKNYDELIEKAKLQG